MQPFAIVLKLYEIRHIKAVFISPRRAIELAGVYRNVLSSGMGLHRLNESSIGFWILLDSRIVQLLNIPTS
jgi:hypothetical protein